MFSFCIGLVKLGVHHLTGEKVPFGFGSNKFAVLLENENGNLKNSSFIYGLPNSYP